MQVGHFVLSCGLSLFLSRQGGHQLRTSPTCASCGLFAFDSDYVRESDLVVFLLVSLLLGEGGCADKGKRNNEG